MKCQSKYAYISLAVNQNVKFKRNAENWEYLGRWWKVGDIRVGLLIFKTVIPFYTVG